MPAITVRTRTSVGSIWKYSATPPHTPPHNAGSKYNPVNGGPAGTEITAWVQQQANQYMEARLAGVRRVPFAQACTASTTHTHDYLDAYVADLGNVVDFDVIRGSGLKLAVDPLGGAGVHYWAPIAKRYQIDLSVVSEEVESLSGFDVR